MKKCIRCLPTLFLLLLFAAAAAAAPAAAARSTLPPQRLAQLIGDEGTITLIVVDDTAAQRLVAQQLAQVGGRLFVAAGHYVLLAHIQPGAMAAVRALPHVVVATQNAREAKAIEHADPHVALAAGYLEWTKSGERRRYYEHGAAAKPPHEVGDAFVPPEPETASGLFAPSGLFTTLQYPNEVMDDIQVSAILVESDGTIDTNEFTWSSSDYSVVFGQVCDGLNFWADNGYQYGVTAYTQVVFYSRFYNSQVNQGYEPIRHSGANESLWIAPIMHNFGFNQTGYFDRVRAFNNARAAEFGTTYATTIFIAYNPSGAPSQFTNGLTAWAYLGGPFVMTTFRPWGDGSLLPATVAHEYAHNAWACDEYNAPGYYVCSCSLCYSSGPRTYLNNGNCEVTSCNANPAACIMRSTSSDNFNNFRVCNTTLRQIGWVP